jgi:hypothetical protein
MKNLFCFIIPFLIVSIVNGYGQNVHSIPQYKGGYPSASRMLDKVYGICLILLIQMGL